MKRMALGAPSPLMDRFLQRGLSLPGVFFLLIRSETLRLIFFHFQTRTPQKKNGRDTEHNPKYLFFDSYFSVRSDHR